MNRSQIPVTFVATMLSVQVFGAMLPGSEPKEWPANPEKHTISINREAADDVGKKMIEAAEKAKPDSGTWWMQKDGEPVMTLGLKTPHAITKGALDYYTAKIKEYQKTKWRGYSEPSSSLTYKAVVSNEDSVTLSGKEFKNVYVVKMELTVMLNSVNSEGGVTFMKKRTVVLDANGVPQAIEGDGDEQFPVWMR